MKIYSRQILQKRCFSNNLSHKIFCILIKKSKLQPNYGLLQAVAPALHKLVQIARSVFHKHLRWLVWLWYGGVAVKTHNLKVAFTVTQKEAIMNEWIRLSFAVKWLPKVLPKPKYFYFGFDFLIESRRHIVALSINK